LTVSDPGLWHACGTTTGPYPAAQRLCDLLTDTIGAVFADGTHDVDSAIFNPQLLGFCVTLRLSDYVTVNTRSWFVSCCLSCYRKLSGTLSQDR
jgi:hypothetical protein